MTLRDELKSAALRNVAAGHAGAARQQALDEPSKPDAALQQAADEAYERLTRWMKEAPLQKSWRFPVKVTPAVAEVLQKRFNKEGYLVIFRFFSIEIIDDDQQ